MIGTVKWFDDAKGYGVVTPNDGGEDVSLHSSEIRIEGIRSLKKGWVVVFEVEQGAQGPAAKNVRPGHLGYSPDALAMLEAFRDATKEAVKVAHAAGLPVPAIGQNGEIVEHLPDGTVRPLANRAPSKDSKTAKPARSAL
jgi:cold shock protein